MEPDHGAKSWSQIMEPNHGARQTNNNYPEVKFYITAVKNLPNPVQHFFLTPYHKNKTTPNTKKNEPDTLPCKKKAAQSSFYVVAGAGLEPATFGL